MSEVKASYQSEAGLLPTPWMKTSLCFIYAFWRWLRDGLLGQPGSLFVMSRPQALSTPSLVSVAQARTAYTGSPLGKLYHLVTKQPQIKPTSSG